LFFSRLTDFLLPEAGERGQLLPLAFLTVFRLILDISEFFVGGNCMSDLEMLAD
jgi:hypothetical protein